MSRYLLRRLLILIPMILAASVVIFLLLRLGTGDPAMDYLRLSSLPPTPEMIAATRAQLGLDQPLAAQYLHWLWRALHLDFGISYATQRPVLDDVLHFLPATLLLAGAALALILLISVPLGIWAARHRDGLPDFIVRAIAFLGVSMPNFWLAFLLVMFFSVHLQWLPALGYGGWQHLILPAVSIALMSLSINARLLRASMLEAAGQRHVTWARLRGLNEKQTERGHILRNAGLPVITALGMHIGELIGGTMIIENIFAWPGIGRYAVSAIFNRDYPVIQCFTLVMVVVFVLCNLVVDLLSAALDPRIRHHEGAH
ncbi:nickel ABC transporter permease subunit NikB [Kosakonia radicincitans DSM 16656]|uniref:Nickel transport system permease protein n=1 Tax=Kosakonia radicincitans TaxID=283686 RepID=A0AAX2EU88_9ENTR|nr:MULTISPECIES: nickel ABC transporter permease subunit NikB [Kosakonia]MDP9567773.1 nickel transport system permease protein [Kosakonia oryzae]APG20376.1 nickel ABC transporter permease subunit NikB [Kosakonia radicincitans]ARD58599.1 nickel ABC transporter permease subunit NikB [Kosakonia radicincitans DSM 16656]KDE36473.1 nickel transporter permease NikB [Kosakonia radicincitans UMEnt01/12]MDD7994341.1 nickel ABC transporter permease subunit NikB [Kosakonia radicincitans]